MSGTLQKKKQKPVVEASFYHKPKILLIDIETFPNVGYSWGKWEQDVIDFVEHWYILCVGYKWFGDKKGKVVAIPDFPHYHAGKKDKEVVEVIKELLEEADIVIAHNGKQFDVKKINTRFLEYGMSPPSPYKIIDTKIEAKRHFSFNSNKLDELGRDLEIGRKMEHEGFPLWIGCKNGDKESWNKMKKYNLQDVELLEKLYIKLRPWMNTHPNLEVYGQDRICPKCGSTKVQSRGYGVANSMIYHQFQCMSCGGWSRRTTDGVRGSYNKPV